MAKCAKLHSTLAFFVLFFVFMIGSVQSGEPPDTTKQRELYPEKKALSEKIMVVPQFVLDIPFDILEGFTRVIVDDLYAGPLVTKIASMVGDFDRIWGFYPVFNIGSRSGAEFGLAFRSKGAFTVEDRLKVKGSYSTHDYQYYKVRYRPPYFIDENLDVTFLGQYRQSPWESFYGLGQFSLEEDEVNYNPEHSFLSTSGLWALHPELSLNLTLGYHAYNIFDGEDTGLEGDLDVIRPMFGLSLDDTRGTRFWSIGGTLDHDWRNNAGQPTSGGREILTATYNKSTRDLDDFNFTFVSVDLRHYLHLYNKRTLAVRVLAQSTDVSNDTTVLPFYLKSALGGVESLRGYREGRFIDNDLALISIEYRYPLLHIIDAFVFLDEARVFNNWSDGFVWRDWEYSYGAGLRVWETDELKLRTFVAKSEEGTRYYFEFSDAF